MHIYQWVRICFKKTRLKKRKKDEGESGMVKWDRRRPLSLVHFSLPPKKSLLGTFSLTKREQRPPKKKGGGKSIFGALLFSMRVVQSPVVHSLVVANRGRASSSLCAFALTGCCCGCTQPVEFYTLRNPKFWVLGRLFCAVEGRSSRVESFAKAEGTGMSRSYVRCC